MRSGQDPREIQYPNPGQRPSRRTIGSVAHVFLRLLTASSTMRIVVRTVHSKLSMIAAVTALILSMPSAGVAGPHPDARHSEAYFPSADGRTMLHADILRPFGVRPSTPTPVIMTVSPYLNQGTGISPLDERPDERFYDFLDVTKVLERGYTYVMVDLPGFGGSGGCNDWGGLREQGAVEAAVEWAASRPWSTGRVALLGKSYDAWTGLMGIARQPKGLAAVVAMEPVYSGYRYLYTNGVRFPNSFGTPLIFQLLDAKPGVATSSPRYQVNGAPRAWCYGVNVAMQQQDHPGVPFWMERDLLPAVIGKKTPLFLTQGFLETNTRPDGAFEFFDALDGPKRAWFGQFDHVRGWEKAKKRFLTGRSSFAAELMRFLDRHLKGARVKGDPAVAVQDNLGRYRAERAWPPGDARTLWSSLNPGEYTDDGENTGTGAGGGNGVWSLSQPLPHDVWMAGEPELRVDAETVLPRANLAANLYDVGPGGRATLISRGTVLLRKAGRHRTSLEMYGQDWLLRRGHRIGVLVSGANADWWAHLPTMSPVTVHSGRVGLPFLRSRRDTFLDGGPSPRLEDHVRRGFVEVSRPTMEARSRTFRLPPPLD